jgi:hypothetical protein
MPSWLACKFLVGWQIAAMSATPIANRCWSPADYNSRNRQGERATQAVESSQNRASSSNVYMPRGSTFGSTHSEGTFVGRLACPSLIECQ